MRGLKSPWFWPKKYPYPSHSSWSAWIEMYHLNFLDIYYLKSHSSWSAWIEIISWKYRHNHTNNVALFMECVDWNCMLVCPWYLVVACRTLHGVRGLKFFKSFVCPNKTTVALFMECVDWNSNHVLWIWCRYVALFMECVDWNLLDVYYPCRYKRRTLHGVRGLKY